MNKNLIWTLLLIGQSLFGQDDRLIQNYMNFYLRDTTFTVEYCYEYDTLTRQNNRYYDPHEVTIPRFKFMDNFIRFEQAQINCIDWLISTPITLDAELREKVEHFVLDCPDVSLIVNDDIINDLISENDYGKDIEKAYKLGTIRYLIKNTYEADTSKIQLAGLKSVIGFYASNSDLKIKKASIIKSYETEKNEDDLINWIEKYY